MTRDYATVRSRFWNGDTGRQLRAIGRDELLIAIYLITCPNSNMLGLFYLPLTTIAHELGMSLEGASKALRRVVETGFCQYDQDAEEIWVPEMARHQVGERMAAEDNRVKAIRKQATLLGKSRFFLQFVERYGDAFHLADLKKIARPSEAPSKPLRSQEQDQDQDQEQEQETLCGPHAGGHGVRHVKDQPNRIALDTSKENYPVEFEAFWVAYPPRGGRKRGKNKSFALWRQLIRQADRQAVVQAAANYADSDEARRGYARDPERFLRADWWREWCQPAEAIAPFDRPSQYPDPPPRRTPPAHRAELAAATGRARA